MTLSALPARYLDRRELIQLVEDLAGQPGLWSDHVNYSGGLRH